MNFLIEVRSNSFYDYIEEDGKVKLKPRIEVVIIHTKGFDYTHNEQSGELEKTPKFVESRMIVSPEILADLIAQLQVCQSNMQAISANADGINSLIQRFQK